MNELRRDPVTSRWVLIAADRRDRPHDIHAAGADAVGKQATAGSSSAACPFCPGNESHTPPEVHADRTNGRADASGWSTRVVPNKFPAVRPDAGSGAGGDALHGRMDGVGAHEVIIESPEHGVELSELPPEAVERFLRAARGRMRELGRDPRIRYIQFFKNHGAAAGASLEHGHAQLIALPVAPAALEEEWNGAARYWERETRCVYCDMVADTRREGRRLVYDEADMAAIAPWAPRFPYETWIVPHRHESSFEAADDATLRALALALRETLARLRRALHGPHYNFLLHTAPCRAPRLPHYHWHVEIFPRLQPIAGFEWGTGFTINTMPPEEAADCLLQVEI
jgi:UDPglucose--hexose-1-phosphate uridylyltransferase